MSNNIELLSTTENFTIGTNSNLSQILANVVKVGTDTSNVTISIPQDISSSYNLILPVRQGASGESLVYGADGQLKWDDPTVLKQVVSVFGSNLGSDKVDVGEMSSVSFPTNYQASITPLSANTKIFVQFKINYKAALSSDNQVDFYIYKHINGSQTPDKIFSETMYGPYIGTGGFVGQYISNLIDEPNTTDEITYKLGYKVNGTVDISDTLGILGYDVSYNNTIVLQEFEGSGVYAASVWNKGADSNGLYYNDGTVHIGSTKDALGSQNTPGVALELSGNLVGTNAYFSGQVNADTINAREGYFSANTLYINNKPVLNEDAAGNRTVNTDVIVSDASNGLTIKAIGDNGNIILDPSGTGTIQLNGDVQLSGGNINAETFIGDLSGNVTGTVSSLSNHTTDNLTEGSTNKYFSTTLVNDHLSGGTGVTYSNGSISIGQSVGTSANVQFNNVTVDGTLNSDDITGSNVTVSNDLVVSGNLTVNGTRTIVNATTLDIGDNKIVVNAAGSTTDAGIIANVSGTEHEFVYSTNNNAWGTTGDLNIGGNVTGTTFIGDGSQLTGITDTTYTAGDGLSLDGTTFNNTAPDQTVTISGSGATTVTGTYPNFTITSTDTNTTYTAGTGLSLDGTTFNIPQSVGTSDNVQFNNVTATTFIGDGSQLTNISAGANLTNNSDASFGSVDINNTLTIIDNNNNNISYQQIGSDIYGEANEDKSGWSISLNNDGTIVAIGAPYNDGNGGNSGHVRVYQYSNSSWTQLGNDIDGETSNNFIGYGTSISLSSDGLRIAIGSFYNTGSGNRSGHVRVFEYNTGTTLWTQLGSDIDGEAELDQSGIAVSLSSDGTIVAIGAAGNDGGGANSGHVRVYQYSNSSWTQLGSDIDGEAAGDNLGNEGTVSLSSDGTILAIGGVSNDGNNGVDSGHVRVYQYSNSSWTQLGSDIDGEAAFDYSGRVSLSSDGTILAIGASHHNGNNGTGSGQVKVYQYSNSSWIQLGNTMYGDAVNDHFGFRVALSEDGNTLIVGNIEFYSSNTGYAKIFKYISGSWTQIGSNIYGKASADKFSLGLAISKNGSIVAIGAPENDDSGTDVGVVQVYELIQEQNNIQIINGNISGVNTITATRFFGDGSQLTGITDTTYTAGTGVTLSGTTFSIGQAVATNSDVTFSTSTQTHVSADRIYGRNFKNNNDFIAIGVPNGDSRIFITSNGGSNYSLITSDDRLKFNETHLTNALSAIRKLNPVVYDKMPYEPTEEVDFLPFDQSSSHVEAGFIAQEVLNIPELRESVIAGEDPTKHTYMLNYSHIFTYAVKAIQELNVLVNTLQSRIDVLESK